MNSVYFVLLLVVIGGHLYFAYKQWAHWPWVCKKLTELEGEQIVRTAFLGRSFASYNAAIGAGLGLTFLLDAESQVWVQAAVLAFIVATAAVGNAGTKGNTIFIGRLLPAALALLMLLISYIL